jgi:(p)ppGpp synthase/HD superfamily hydrolase
MENLIEKARLFAALAHSGQVRKYTGESCLNHCKEVVSILEEHDIRDPEMIAAAWLHDTIEDALLTREDLTMLLEEHDVISLVVELTHIARPEDGNRAERKAKDRSWLANASARAQTIKCADIISNTISIVERDPKFAKIYIPEMRLLLKVLKFKADPGLWERASSIVAKAEQKLL